VPDIDPEQAADRIRKLIIVGDNRLKQGGGDVEKARGTFTQALRLAEEAGVGDHFRPFIEARLAGLDRLAGQNTDVE